MTDSNPPKSPEESVGKPDALEVTQRADHPLEAELRDPAAGKSASGSATASAEAGGWERAMLEKVLMASIREQRAARRWRIFFRFVSLAIVGLIFYAFASFEGETVSTGRHTALVSLDGEIAARTNASAENINASLQAAFADDNTVGVILKINSPGGSPVQAGMINDEIRRLRAKYKKIPLYVVVEEMCASGGYYVAAAADKIYVDKASIVGSIGVLMDGFGFTGLMSKLGVERRLHTSGENKGFYDPFSPETPKMDAHAQALLDQVHAQFIKAVKDGRGKRLHETPDMFSGLFWTGEKSVELGLADGYGTTDTVARDVLKAPDLVDYTVKESLTNRVARKFGAAVGSAAMKALAAGGASFSLR
jgi:protease-4